MLPAGVDTFHIWRNLCLILKTSAAWSYIHGKKAHCDGYFFWPHLVMHILTCPKNVCHPSKEQYWFSNTAEGQDRCRDLQHFLRQSQSAWHDPCAKRHEHRTCNRTWKNNHKVWITLFVCLFLWMPAFEGNWVSLMGFSLMSGAGIDGNTPYQAQELQITTLVNPGIQTNFLPPRPVQS